MITPNHIPAHLSPDVGPWPDELWSIELAGAARDVKTLLNNRENNPRDQVVLNEMKHLRTEIKCTQDI